MLATITHYNSLTNSREAKNILILYDPKNKMFIGDTYILINKLASCSLFFTNASIDINCRNKQNTTLCSALLKNNPFIREFSDTTWEELDFRSYDIVFCISQKEALLLEILQEQYDRMPLRPWTTAVYSMSVQFLNWGPDPVVSSVFPAFREILDQQAEYIAPVRSELYISKEEKDWANRWLRNNGLKEHERLFIILDSASERYKLLPMDTYHTVLSHLLNEDSAKLLFFDEQNIGKEKFYSEWLGTDKVSKMIFSKKLSLREALCILGSDYTKLIFGPCTGLIHCASGIYNNFVRNGMPAGSIPAIITYTGKYVDGHTAAYWWGNSPLVTCLILRATPENNKEVVLLSELSEEEKKDTSPLLFSSEYTPEQILNFLPAYSHTMVI
jgi:hypothetical protein